MAARVSTALSDGEVGTRFEAQGAALACAAVAVVCGDEPLAEALLEESGLSNTEASRPDSLHLAKINLNYALTLSYLGRSEQALLYAERAISIWEELGGPENREYFGALSIVALIDTEVGNYERARTLFEQLLEAGRTNRDSGADQGITLYQLARVLALQGHTEQALDRLRQSVANGFDNEAIFDDEHLRSLRGLPEFEALVAEVEHRISADGPTR